MAPGCGARSVAPMTTIVVGVDRSPGALAALRFALAEARLRGATVKLVHAWEVPAAALGGASYFAIGGLPELERAVAEDAERVIDELLEQVGDDAEGVDVEREVVSGNAAHALLNAAKGASLLVVGSRGRGGFAGLLLGSVSQHCAHHATCPVAIVHPS